MYSPARQTCLGSLSKLQEVWDDAKNVVHDLGMEMQVSYGTPSLGQQQHLEEALAQVISSESAVVAAQRLLQKKIRSIVALLYRPEAKLLLCSQVLLGIRGPLWFTYGWWATDWYEPVFTSRVQTNMSSQYPSRAPQESMYYSSWRLVPRHNGS